MFCLEERKSFKTVKELKQFLDELPDDFDILVNQNHGWFHIDYHKCFVTLESSPMSDKYKWYDYFPDLKYQDYSAYSNFV